MVFSKLILSLSFVSLVLANPIKSEPRRPNILMTNDDGWAVAQVRGIFAMLDATGKYNLLLSCPAVDKSGTANTTATPAVTTVPCEFDSCPVGAPAVGSNAADPRLNYVNAFPVDSVTVGIQKLAPKVFNGQKVDFVVAGSNIGNNLGETCLQISGTCHAAGRAVQMGYPAVAFSGASVSFVSYTTLESDPTANFTQSAVNYSELTLKFVETLLGDFDPSNNRGGSSGILPSGVVVNVNYPPTDKCSRVEDFKWVFTRMLQAKKGTRDVETCGNHGVLTDENTAIQEPGCWITVSVFDAVTWNDVDVKRQQPVLDMLKPILSCQNEHH